MVAQLGMAAAPAEAIPGKPSKLVLLDRLVGLRGWGLVLYGALPANLALIGAIKVEMKPIASLPLFLAVVVPLPIIMMYLMVQTRQKEWYLTTNWLTLRSTITTLLVIVLATLISGAAKLIQGEYIFGSHLLFTKDNFTAMGESFLFGIASLVVSSTLFMTVLSKGADLPGLPSTAFVGWLAKIRQGLKQIQQDLIWQAGPADIRDITGLEGIAQTLKNNIEASLAEPGHRLAKQSVIIARADLDCFLHALDEIKSGHQISQEMMIARWAICFGLDASMQEWQKERRLALSGMVEALQRIRGLRLGG